MALVDLKKKIFEIRQCIFAIFKNYLSLESAGLFFWTMYFFAILWFSYLGKWWGPWFEQTWVPFTTEWFVLSLVEISPVVLEKKTKIYNVYRQMDGRTDRQTDDGQQAIKKAHLSIQLRRASNSSELYIKEYINCCPVFFKLSWWF